MFTGERRDGLRGNGIGGEWGIGEWQGGGWGGKEGKEKDEGEDRYCQLNPTFRESPKSLQEKDFLD